MTNPQDVRVIEVVRGLGMGGAERILQQRLNTSPLGFKVYLLNTKPKLDKIDVSVEQKDHLIADSILKLAQGIRDLNPNILISRTPIDLINVIFIRIFFGRDFKIVHEAHAIFLSPSKLKSFLIAPFYYFAVKRADLVVCVSNAVRIGKQGRDAKKYLIEYMGSNIRSLGESEHIPQNTGPRLLFIGRITKVKRPDRTSVG